MRTKLHTLLQITSSIRIGAWSQSFLFGFACFLFVTGVLVTQLTTTAANPPNIITYQGKLLEGGISATTTKAMKFVIYDASVGGIAVYTASGTLPTTSTILVSPTSGIFSIDLGDTGTNPINPDIFSTGDLYLEVTIDGTTLSPRKRLSAVPFAVNAARLGGNFATSTPTTTNYIPVASDDGSFRFNTTTIHTLFGGPSYFSSTTEFLGGYGSIVRTTSAPTFADFAVFELGSTVDTEPSGFIRLFTNNSAVGAGLQVRSATGTPAQLVVVDGRASLQLGGDNMYAAVAFKDQNGADRFTFNASTSSIEASLDGNITLGQIGIGEAITNAGYIMNGNDVYVSDLLGVGGSLYVENDILADTVSSTAFTLNGDTITSWPTGNGDSLFTDGGGYLHPNTSTYPVVIGSDSTSTADSIFEVTGTSTFSGDISVSDTLRADEVVVDGGITLGGDRRTSWPAGGGDSLFVDGGGYLHPNTSTYPVVIGNTVTSTANSVFEVTGTSTFSGSSYFNNGGASFLPIAASRTLFAVGNPTGSRVGQIRVFGDTDDLVGNFPSIGLTDVNTLITDVTLGSANGYAYLTLGGATSDKDGFISGYVAGGVSPSFVFSASSTNSNSYILNDFLIGSAGESITNAAFVMNGNDGYVSDLLGVGGSLYVENDILADTVSSTAFTLNGDTITSWPTGNGDSLFTDGGGYLHPNTSTYPVVIGSDSTSTADSIFEVTGTSTFSGDISVSDTLRADEVVVDGGITLGGDRRTSWPAGGGDSLFVDGGGYLHPNTSTYPVVIGNTVTSTANSVFEVTGPTHFSSSSQFLGGNVSVYRNDSLGASSFDIGSAASGESSGMLVLRRNDVNSGSAIIFTESSDITDQQILLTVDDSSEASLKLGRSNTYGNIGLYKGINDQIVSISASSSDVNYIGTDLVIGNTSGIESITNPNFSFSGNDAYVEDLFGVGGSVYVENDIFTAGTSTAAEFVATGGLTLGGERRTSWPAAVTQNFVDGGGYLHPNTSTYPVVLGASTQSRSELLEVQGDGYFSDTVTFATDIAFTGGMTVGHGNNNWSENVAIGTNVLPNLTLAKYTVAVGANTLTRVGSAGGNTAIGYNGIRYINAAYNTAVGAYALQGPTSGTRDGEGNTAIGHRSMEKINTGDGNAALGASSAANLSTGDNNIAIGGSSAPNLTTGSGNTLLGTFTGGGLTTGSNNTIIGASVTGLSSSVSSNIILADGQGRQRLRVLSNGYVGIGTTTPATFLTIAGDSATHGTSTIYGNMFVGATSEAITTSTFVLDGDDAYIHDLLGVGGSIYVENSVHIGTSSLHLSGDVSGGIISMTDGPLAIDSYDGLLSINNNSSQDVFIGTAQGRTTIGEYGFDSDLATTTNATSLAIVGDGVSTLLEFRSVDSSEGVIFTGVEGLDNGDFAGLVYSGDAWGLDANRLTLVNNNTRGGTKSIAVVVSSTETLTIEEGKLGVNTTTHSANFTVDGTSIFSDDVLIGDDLFIDTSRGLVTHWADTRPSTTDEIFVNYLVEDDDASLLSIRNFSREDGDFIPHIYATRDKDISFKDTFSTPALIIEGDRPQGGGSGPFQPIVGFIGSDPGNASSSDAVFTFSHNDDILLSLGNLSKGTYAYSDLFVSSSLYAGDNLLVGSFGDISRVAVTSGAYFEMDGDDAYIHDKLGIGGKVYIGDSNDASALGPAQDLALNVAGGVSIRDGMSVDNIGDIISLGGTAFAMIGNGDSALLSIRTQSIGLTGLSNFDIEAPILDIDGEVDISGTTTIYGKLDVNNYVEINMQAEGVVSGLQGLCKQGTAGSNTDKEIVNCAGSASDIAEIYENTPEVEKGDIVMTTDQTVTYTEELFDPITRAPIAKDGVDVTSNTLLYKKDQVIKETTISVLTRATNLIGSTPAAVVGVVSTNPAQVLGSSALKHASNPQAIAITGRVPTKVNLENGSIAIGDGITLSSDPGVGMKADSGDFIVGIALESYSGGSDSKIMVAIMPGEHGLLQKIETLESKMNEIYGAISSADFESFTIDYDSVNNIVGYEDGPFNLGGDSIFGVRSVYGFAGRWRISSDGLVISSIETTKGTKELYALQSEKAEIVLSGTGTLEDGQTQIEFEDIYTEIIDPNEPMKITVTLTDEANGVYVTDKSTSGFMVRELANGDSNATFDWVAIVYRNADIEAPAIPNTPSVAGEGTEENDDEEEDVDDTVDEEETVSDSETPTSSPNENIALDEENLSLEDTTEDSESDDASQEVTSTPPVQEGDTDSQGDVPTETGAEVEGAEPSDDPPQEQDSASVEEETPELDEQQSDPPSEPEEQQDAPQEDQTDEGEEVEIEDEG